MESKSQPQKTKPCPFMVSEVPYYKTTVIPVFEAPWLDQTAICLVPSFMYAESQEAWLLTRVTPGEPADSTTQQSETGAQD